MTDYTTLQADVAAWLAKDSLTAVIPSFIRLAEVRIRRDVRIRQMSKRARTTGEATRFISLPNDYLELRTLRLVNDSGEPIPLDETEPDSLSVRSTSGGNPTSYCVHRELEFDAVVPRTTSIEMVYYGPFESLATASTNWLSENAEDVYLYGALMQAEPYLKNDDRIDTWANGYLGAVDAVNEADKRARRSRGGRALSMTRGGVTP